MIDENHFWRGDVLKIGESTRPLLDTKKGKMVLFFTYLFGAIIPVVVLLIMDLTIGLKKLAFLPEHSALVILFPVLLFSVAVLYIYGPLYWNCLPIIYETGLSSTSAPYIPFSEISEIGYGYMPSGSRFIKVFSKGKNPNKCPFFRESDYTNDFFECVRKTLKDKCPDVKWRKYDWVKRKKKGWQYDPTLKGESSPDADWLAYTKEEVEN